jgi:hypothetical protein
MAGVVCDAADLEGDVPDRVEREKWDYPCVGAEVVRGLQFPQRSTEALRW